MFELRLHSNSFRNLKFFSKALHHRIDRDKLPAVRLTLHQDFAFLKEKISFLHQCAEV